MTHFIISGAGIGGLTTALALAQVGATVTVLERRRELDAVGAGLQLAPNATRILDRLGVLGQIRDAATEPQAIRIGRGRDGTEIARLPIGEEARKRYGAPFLVIHRADLQHILLEAVRGSGGVRVQLEATVTGVAATEAGVVITYQTQDSVREIKGDGFVDAGGVAGSGDLDRRSARLVADRLAWRALIPAASLPDTYAEPNTRLWLGPDAHIVHYPVRGRSLVNVVVVTHVAREAVGREDLWSRHGDTAVLEASLKDWSQPVARLVAADATWRCWPMFDERSHSRWSRDTVTKVGDAAHPMLPFLAQGASQSVEDAAALASAAAGRGAAAAFQLYERERRGRASRVQRASRRQGQIYHLARPASDARDAVLRLLSGRRALARLDWLYAPADAAIR